MATTEKRSFLMLLSTNKDSAVAAKAFLARIKANVDPTASPQWIDSKGIGVLISTDLPAWKVWREAWPESLSRDQQMDLQNFLIVQVGPDWHASGEDKAAAWLNARFPKR